MTDPGPVVRLVAGVGLVTALAGCAPSDRTDSTAAASVPGPGQDAGDPLPPVSLPDLSNLTAWAQDQVRARDAALRALLADPAAPNAALVGAYGDLGLALMATEYYEAAAASYRQAQALAPRDRRWPYYLGQLHLMTLDPVQAAAWFERALDLATSDEATLVWLGRTRLDQGRPEAAERLFAHAAAVEPRSAAAWAGAGRAALARHDYLRATESLERALQLDPRASTVHYPLAMAYRALGRLELANAHLQRRGAREPTLVDPLMVRFYDVLESPMVFERRGVQALAEGDWETAAGIFRQGLELDPDIPALRERLATALAMGGDTGAAVALLEETLRQAPEFARAHVSLAGIHALNRRFRQAVAHYEIALGLEPTSVEARMGLAEALRADGRLEASLAPYAQVVQADPGAADAWIGRADALIRLGRYDEARAWLADAQAIYPERPELASLAAIIARRR